MPNSDHIRIVHQMIVSGRHEEAIAQCTGLLRDEPGNLQILFMLGLSHFKAGHFSNSLSAYSEALRANPREPNILLNRGICFAYMKRYEDALNDFKSVLRLDANNFSALCYVGLALFELGRTGESLEYFDKAIILKPAFAEAYYNKAKALAQLKKIDEAIIQFRKAAQLEPRNFECFNNLGNCYLELNEPLKAVESYESAIALKSDYAEAYGNRANALIKLGRIDDALADYDKAIALKPEYAEAYSNRANAFFKLSRFYDALVDYDRAIALKPDYAEAYSNHANALNKLSRFDDALIEYDKAIALRPDYAEAFYDRAIVLSKLKRRDEALSSYDKAIALGAKTDYLASFRLHEKMQMCLWDHFEKDLADLSTRAEAGEAALIPFSSLGLIDQPALQKRCAGTYIKLKYPEPTRTERATVPAKKDDKITIGYYSADFHDHPMLFLMAEIFERHDRERFRIVGFSFGPTRKSAMRDRVLPFLDAFHDVLEMSDQQVIELSRKERIDIAVDRKGFTENARTSLFAAGLAPIQVNYLAYPGTMGADYIDYIIADPVLIPGEQRQFYAEKVAYLPHSYQPNDRKRVISDKVFTRAELGLPDNAFVYCCFNNNWKITPDIFGLWMRILRQSPGSVLWLFEDNRFVVENLGMEAEKRGVARDRLIFAKRMSLPEHLARHRQADLFLDTLPYNAHTSASDALWAGLPVLTRAGQSFAGRVAASLVKAAGLPELAVETTQDYEILALKFYKDREALQNLKMRLEQNKLSCPLFDSERYVKDLEQLYFQMFERFRSGLAPDHITIENSSY